MERVESWSGWSYLADQENGDQVDCRRCGRVLDDDRHVIVNDDEGYACHSTCLPPAAQVEVEG